MKILFILNSLMEWRNGCWFYRTQVPALALQDEGHEVKHINLVKEIPEEWLKFPDVVVYGRTYQRDPLPSLRQFKEKGAKIVYDLDDDVWNLNPDNPSMRYANNQVEQVDNLIKEADTVTTTTELFKKHLQKKNKSVKVCPNAIFFDKYVGTKVKKDRLRVLYSGAASHWGDLGLILDVVAELQRDYNFLFILQGMCGEPIVNYIYKIKKIISNGVAPEKDDCNQSILEMFEKLKDVDYIHMPFYAPELYPTVLADLNPDIGLAPLKDNAFNRHKSALKFYEYATVGAVTLSSKVIPYKKEVGYTAKNNFKDWHKKLRRLLEDKELRQNKLKEQQDFVFKHRDIRKVVKDWENALCQ